MSKAPADIDGMMPIGAISPENTENADEVIGLADEARDYLDSMGWCERVVDGWLEYSFGYIIGIFYFRIVPAKPDVPEYVWIIVGDIPPTYMCGESHTDSWQALDSYVSEMQEWVDRVRGGRPIDEDVITVNVPPEPQWAESLQKRLDSIRDMFLPEQRGAPESD